MERCRCGSQKIFGAFVALARLGAAVDALGERDRARLLRAGVTEEDLLEASRLGRRAESIIRRCPVHQDVPRPRPPRGRERARFLGATLGPPVWGDDDLPARPLEGVDRRAARVPGE